MHNKELVLLRVGEAADRLGVKESTVRAWVLRRQLGYVRVGKRAVRIPSSEVQRIINEGAVPARVAR